MRPAAWSTLEPSSDARRSGLTDGAESASATTIGASSRYCRRASRASSESIRSTGDSPRWYHAPVASKREASPRVVPALQPSESVNPSTAPPARWSTHCWIRIESAAARAVRRGRRPPSQLTVPVNRGERIRCHSNPSTANEPSASSESRLPARSTRPSARPVSGRASAEVSRFCWVIASSSESNPIRLSAARSKRMRPFRGARQPSVPPPEARAPFHSA